MTTHMLVQFPLLALAGFFLAAALPERWRARLNAWNVYGIGGLFGISVILAILMIPRVLDLALIHRWVELLKWLTLLLGGAAARLSWRPSGLLVQGFFLGNVLPMMAMAGNLYENSPARVCNAYLLDDQVRLGQLLVWISAGVGLAWFSRLALTLTQRDAAAVLPSPPGKSAAATESVARESH